MENKKAWYKFADFAELSAHLDEKSKNPLGDFTHKEIQVTCPKCHGKHCFVRRDDGVFHCWNCSESGQIEEMKEKKSTDSTAINSSTYSPKAINATAKPRPKNSTYDVEMIPSDYKPVKPELLKRLKPIYVEGTPDETQQQAQKYLSSIGISRETVQKTGLMCGTFSYTESDGTTAGMHKSIVYANRIMGTTVNLKMRSCDETQGKFTKFFTQESPTKPCAPFNIDCMAPFSGEQNPVRQLIITEGEKDVLTLTECGFSHVISVSNGAQTDVAASFEAFYDWIMQAEQIVICGDTDLPGRSLTRHLIDYFGEKAATTTYPIGYKDISEVYEAFGADCVQQIIADAVPVVNDEVFTIEDNMPTVLNVLRGIYDHGYDIGMGRLTDRAFHPTNEGGLITVTGIPNSGKTDFLNCMMAHIIAHCHKGVCFLSFELPDKAKHIRQLVKLILGEECLEKYNVDRVLKPIVTYLGRYVTEMNINQHLPTPSHIIKLATEIRKKHRLDYLVIDPYIFVDVNEGGKQNETEQVKTMLTRLQAWGRNNGVWVVVVAHPRIQHKDGSSDFAPLDIYSISGSAHWANLADFLISIKRVNKPDDYRVYSIMEVLKVRDQEFSTPSKVLYVRQPCGRYDERESEEDCVAEKRTGKFFEKDSKSWYND